MKNQNFKQRIQRRCCGICGKNGHNKSTCPQFLATIPAPAQPVATTPSITTQPPRTQYANSGINFFIHHVSNTPEQSAHVVDLKTKNIDLWDQVQSIAPQNDKKLYQYYHELPSADLFEKPKQPIDLQKVPTVSNDEFGLPVLSAGIASAAPIEIQPMEFTPTKPKRLNLKTIADTINKEISGARATVQNTFNSKLFWQRAIAVAAAVLVFGVAPIPAKQYLTTLKLSVNVIAKSSLSGFSSLQKSVSSLLTADTAQAQTDLDRALYSFNAAVNEMQTKHRFLQTVARALPVISAEFKNRENIILAGQSIALGNKYLLAGYANSKNASSTLTDRLKIISTELKSALPHYQNALAKLEPTDPSVLPLEYRDQFKNFKIVFKAIVKDLTTLTELSDNLPEIFGGQGRRRYLLIFQNEHELRPTGGFMGSFAVLEIKDGKIVDIEVPPNGSYDLRGDLDVILEPPAPLLLVNKNFEFQDSNWHPDFPASAEKILWFYRHSRGVTADGVIAINSSVFEQLLKIIGPIQDDARQLVLAHDNALASIQQIVEEGPEKKERRPKQIITDLTPKIIATALNPKPEQLLPLLSGLQDALKQKNIQAYFTDASAQTAVKKFGWGGEILPTAADQDYLFVVNTNIRGEKSDARIQQTISHEAKIAEDGTITDTVLITRQHTGSPEEKFYGADNIDYVRVYVPAGSELISAQGFAWPGEERFFAPTAGASKDTDLAKKEMEIKLDQTSGTRITEEFGKTAFGNWIITAPRQTTQAAFVYRLPFKATADASTDKISHYQLVAQKQSGIASAFDSQILTPKNTVPVWSEGENITPAANGIVINSTNLDQDKIWSLVMKKY